MNEISVIGNFTDCQDFAFFDAPSLAFDYSLNKIKLEKLVGDVNIPRNGNKVVYFFNNKPVHYGVFWNGQVVSKFGTNGKIFKHKIHEIPYKYNNIKYYHGRISNLSDIQEETEKILD